LLDDWATSPVSLREVASLRGVSHTTAMRWKRGEAEIPERHRRAIADLLAARDPEREIASVLAQHPEGMTIRELEVELTSGRARRALRDRLASGELNTGVVVRQRADGRRYECRVIRPGRAGAPESSQKVPQISGIALRGARRRRGLSSVELGASSGLAPGTIRSLEAREAVPVGRVADLTTALGPPLSGAEVRRLRQQAGWSLSELAARVGVTIPTLQAWEVGRRPIPVGRLILLEGALAEAQAGDSAEKRRLADLEDRISVRGPEGVSESELRHSLRRRSAGTHVASPTLERDLALLARRGVIVRSRVAVDDRLGRPRERAVLIHAKWSPQRQPGHSMTGDALADARHRLGLTQQELALAVGSHQSEINRLEHLHDRELQAHWAKRLRKALGDLEGRGSRDERIRSHIRATVRNEPGVPKWRLLQVAGHGKDVVRVFKQLLEAGELRFDLAWDAQGRRFHGLYLRDAAAAPSTMKPGQLRALRERAGWTSTQLAAALGVGHNTVTRWETGARTCPPPMVERIKAALRQAPPEPPADRERRELVIELAEAPGGVLRTELPEQLRGAAGRRLIAGLLAEGKLAESDRLEVIADGRSYRRCALVVPGAQSTTGPLSSMSATELERRRKAAGLSQSGLARELGLSTSAVQRWEARGNVPAGRVADVEAALRRPR
jgi:transcriptional regulator with XRE-family HTH domain